MYGFPFDSRINGTDEAGIPIYDRASNSEELARVLHSFFSDGIFGTGGFAATADGSLTLTLSGGSVLIQGRYGYSPDPISVVLPAAGNQARTDTVVLRLDLSVDKRSIDAYAITGSGNAVPALTRNGTVWELGICNVLRPANSTGIVQSNVTDTRLDAARCGYVVANMQQFDTSDLYLQIQSDLASFRENEKTAFDQFFADVQTTLSGDVAGNLLNLIVGKASTAGRSVLIPVAGWSAEWPYTQNIDVDGVSSNESCHIVLSYDPTYRTDYENCGVRVIAHGNGYVTVEVDEIPDTDFPINLLIINPSSGADEPVTSGNTALLEAIEATAIQLEASGSEITLSDSADAPLMAVTVYGKTTQDGTPEAASPVDLVSVGDYGFVRIDSASDDLTRSAVIQMANALRGLKGTYNTNHTDASGAQWVTDELTMNADGTGEIVRRVACMVYDGTENWSKLGSNGVGNVFSCTPKIPLAHISSPRMTSHFVQSDNSSAYSPAGTTSGYMRDAGDVNNMLFFIRKDLVASVDEWKSFLAAQYAAGTPVVDVYVRETQTQTLTAEEVRYFLQMRTYKPATVITNTDGADMAIRYVADAKTYIDNKFAELSTAMIGG